MLRSSEDAPATLECEQLQRPVMAAMAGRHQHHPGGARHAAPHLANSNPNPNRTATSRSRNKLAPGSSSAPLGPEMALWVCVCQGSTIQRESRCIV